LRRVDLRVCSSQSASVMPQGAAAGDNSFRRFSFPMVKLALHFRFVGGSAP
jgi:hypothetical protein